jgi:hypothetical protein
MIVTEIYNGQGLGNQLFCYITTRSIALENGYEFGIMNPNKFKCLDFLDLDFGKEVIGGSGPEGGPPTQLPDGILNHYNEKQLNDSRFNCNITEIDEYLLNIPDNTKIDGILQSEDYFIKRKSEIKNWLKVKTDIECYEFSDENICIINLRGGEYKGVSDLYLTRNYWSKAVDNMLKINPNFRFVVITDDVNAGKQMFPNYEVYHFNIGKDYSIIKNAHYLILSNSSFSFFPTWTSETVKYVIAPKYWARHNISDGFWSCGYNIYRDWNWMDRDGKIYSYDECISEKNKCKNK